MTGVVLAISYVMAGAVGLALGGLCTYAVLWASGALDWVERRRHEALVKSRLASGDEWMTPADLTKALADKGIVRMFMGQSVPMNVGMWRRDFEELSDLLGSIPFRDGREVYLNSFMEEKASDKSWKVA